MQCRARSNATSEHGHRGFAQKSRKFDTLFVQPLILPKNGVEPEQKGSQPSEINNIRP
jgi:hypothetical protein